MSASTKAAAAAAKIVVTGDIIREFHIYQGSRRFASGDGGAGNRVDATWGGACLIQSILEQTRPGVSALALAVNGDNWPSHLKAHAIYSANAAGFRGDPPPAGGKPEKVWRAAQSLGYGQAQSIPPEEPPVTNTNADAAGRVLVLDDGGAGFRTVRARDRWPAALRENAKPPRWIVLKMSQPLCASDLWRRACEVCSPEVTEQRLCELVVIVSADELRRDGAAINRGLSWERTITDTCQTLAQHPRLSELRRAAHVIVVFRREGALWVHKSGEADSDASGESASQTSGTLVVDPALAEGQWKSFLTDTKAEVFGHLSVFAASISLELADHPETPDFVCAIRRGLMATRELHLRGHGVVSKKFAPGFPFAAIAEVLNGKDPPRLSHQPQDRFLAIPLPCGDCHGAPLPADWTLASRDDAEGTLTPLYGLGFQAAIYGAPRLAAIPHARFGDLLSVDRHEIETLRSLRELIRAYEKGEKQKQPLSLGAFGPPGAGKSFGIKQIAYEILGKDVPFLEFNLSQFSDPHDLIGAFHQVRDKVLGGRTPVVFWDEFDSQELKWLQYLLAPMQDGKFQSGQITHSLGKCIFVFAGATSWDFQHIGPAPEPFDEHEAAALAKRIKRTPEFEAARERGAAEFRLKKGPDFVSRLSGHINVLGPNRRLNYNFATGKWDVPDAADITFPVRRALLLRSFLKARDADVLDIDRDLLNALLRLPRYRHGARSMEKTVEPLREPHAPLRPAQLPPPQVLAQHLDTYADFQKLLAENVAFLTEKNVEKLAAAVHENYRRIAAKQTVYDKQFLDAYAKLDAWGRAANRAAAMRIPHLLAMAGLCVQTGKANDAERQSVHDRLQRFLDPLRREEHAHWMQFTLANGWQQSPDRDAAGKPIRDNARLLHRCLVPFDELSPEDQKKDEEAILTLPETVELVGFKIGLFEDLCG